MVSTSPFFENLLKKRIHLNFCNTKFNIKRNKKYIFLVLLYKILLDLVYVYAISKDYAYYGLDYEQSVFKFILGYIFFFVFLLRFTVTHIEKKKASNKLMFFFEIMYFIPGTTFFTYSSAGLEYSFLFIAFYLLLQVTNKIANRLAKSSSQSISKISFHNKKIIYDFIIFLLLLVTAFYLFYYNGFRIKFDFSDVYTIRSDYRSLDVPTIINYIKNPTGVLIPILLFFCLKKKKFIRACALIIMQLALYAFGANKINLLSLIACIALSVVKKKHLYIYILVGLSLLLSFGLIYHFYSGHLDKITDILIRRTMFTPQKMCHDYFTCFSNLTPDYLRSSFLRYFGFESPYGEITYFIGKYNGTLANCDNGLLGDAFGNFGYYSLLIYPILYMFVFASYNVLCRGLKEEVVVLLSFFYAILFYDSPFFTVLFTHGYVLLFLFFTFIYPYKYECSRKSRYQINYENFNQKNNNKQIYT